MARRLEGRHRLWKGDEATPNSKRGRARRWYPLAGQPCESCGQPATDRHHRDGDTGNNEPANIALLCSGCHLKSDGRLEQLTATSAAKRRAATHCKRGHEFAPENTRWWRGQRACRICLKAARDRWHERTRLAKAQDG